MSRKSTFRVRVTDRKGTPAMKKLLTTAALAIALGAMSLSPAVAQTPARTGPMMGMMGGGCPTMGMMGMMGQGMTGGPGMTGGQATMGRGAMMGGPARMDAMVDGRLAYLKSELKIGDAQMDAWNGYAEAIKSRMDAMQQMRQGMMEAMQQGSATERMDARIKGMEAMVDALKAAKPATEKLYAVLNDEQKKMADQLIGMDCGAM